MLSADSIRFLAAMLRSPARVGAIAPSSAALARTMIRGIDLTNGHAVLELGPGTGPITRALHAALADPSVYLGIERDGAFVELLRNRLPRMRVVEGSAERAVYHLREAGHERVGAIISGLPFASLPAGVQDGVVEALGTLMGPSTVFRTFQYVHAWPLPSAVRFRQRMCESFGPCRISRPVLRNVPPAFVLSWRGTDRTAEYAEYAEATQREN